MLAEFAFDIVITDLRLPGMDGMAVIDNARERGCAEIGLYLLKSTKHNRLFYEKYGFEVFGLEMRQSLR